MERTESGGEAERATPGGEVVRPDAESGDESTVGTGSAVAVGCTAATLVVIVVGVAVLLLLRLV